MQDALSPTVVAADEGVPVPPAFRRGDERRAVGANPELCAFCQRHARRAGGRSGPRPQHCDHVWSTDDKGKPVTCARLDEAHDLWLAVYGGTGPVSDLDVAAQARHLADLRTAVEALFAALDPVRGDVTQLDQRLTGEVADALARAERAASDAERARRETQDARAARDQAIKDREAAERGAADARRAEGAALVERDEANAAARTAAERETDERTRANGLFTLLQAANKTNAEQAGTIGELTGANNQLTTQVDELSRKVTELEGRLEQERAAARTEAENAATAAQKKLDQLREAHVQALDTQRTELAREHRAAQQELTGQITGLTTELALARADAATAKTSAERNLQTAADLRKELDRLRNRLVRLAAAPEASESPLQAAILALLDESPDQPAGEQNVDDPEEGPR